MPKNACPGSEPETQLADQVSPRRVLIVIGALLLGMFGGAGSDGGLHGFADDRRGSGRRFASVVDRDRVPVGVDLSTPLWGKLGDLYGRKTFFQAAIAIFLDSGGVAACAVASDAQWRGRELGGGPVQATRHRRAALVMVPGRRLGLRSRGTLAR